MHYYRLTAGINAFAQCQLGNVTVTNHESIVDASRFTSSVRHTGRNSLLIKADNPPCFDFYLAAFDVPVVSQRFGALLASIAKDDVQLIPVTVMSAPGYFILNSLRRLKCLDESRSLFTKWEPADGRPDRAGQYRMIVELKVVVASSEHADIFRIDGWDVPLIVSETIRQAYLDNRLSGAVFESVS